MSIYGAPHTYCEKWCPRQLTHSSKDCQCGGAIQEWEDFKKETIGRGNK